MKKAIFLDRDGVINKDIEGYVTSVDKFVFLDGVIEAIKLLNENSYIVIVVTNQSPIGRGLMTVETLNEIHKKMIDELKKNNASIDKIYYCPHAPTDNCDCRKPKPGMLLCASKDFGLDLSKCYLVGNEEKDIITGETMGCKCYLVDEKNNLLSIVKKIIDEFRYFQ